MGLTLVELLLPDLSVVRLSGVEVSLALAFCASRLLFVVLLVGHDQIVGTDYGRLISYYVPANKLLSL